MGQSIPTITIVPASKRLKVLPLIETMPDRFICVNDAFIETFNRPERYQILKGGAGSSKSHNKGLDLLLKCLCNKFFKLLYCRKFKSQIRDSQFALLVKLIKQNKWEKYFSFSEAENSSMIIKCTINGNIMIPKGLDAIGKLTSIDEFTDVWIEEPLDKLTARNNVSEKEFYELDRRIRTLNASTHMHLTFNPISTNNWIYENFFDVRSEKYAKFHKHLADPSKNVLTYAHHSTFLDNYFIDRELEEEKFSRQGAYEYRIYALGEWGLLKADTPFFYEFNMEKHVDDIEFNADKNFIISIDFNTDYMATSVWQVNKEANIAYCVHEFPPCVGLDARINTILTSKFMPYLEYCYLTGDATGQNRDQKTPNMTHYKHMKSKLNLRSSQMKVATGNTPHRTSQLLSNSVIQHMDFCIDRSCVNMQSDLQSTEDDGEGGILKKAYDPHYGDGFRYMCQNFLGKHIELLMKRG